MLTIEEDRRVCLIRSQIMDAMQKLQKEIVNLNDTLHIFKFRCNPYHSAVKGAIRRLENKLRRSYTEKSSLQRRLYDVVR